MLLRAAVSIALLLAPGAAAEIMPSGKRVLVLSPETERVFADVFVHSLTGLLDRELAAFVVEERDGTLGCIYWESRAGRRAESFSGVVPSGTVAVVHSHPDASSPRPSRTDSENARRLGLPFIVVSRTEIWIAGAHGGPPVNLARGYLWARGGARDCVCRNGEPPAPPPARAELAQVRKEP